MAGNAEPNPPPSVGTRSRRWVIPLVLVLVALLAASAALYYGLSAPRPPVNTAPHDLGIIVSPSSGNNTTEFTFTAQATDDQDPASAIQVRWDWQNDSMWDTSWSTMKTSTHVFPIPGHYTVRLEAKDTGNLTANATRSMDVAAPPDTAPRILGILVVPTAGSNLTTFNFTAQVTDLQDPVSAIRVRWDWQNDSVWDTPWSTNKTAAHRFPVPGDYVVALEAQDTHSLTSNATKSLLVSAADQPPQIQGIDIAPASGNTSTTFTFTARVSDDYDPASAIQVRWDWQNDSVWDTPWSTNKLATHVFPQSGTYTVRLEARDTANLTVNASRSVNVSKVPKPLRIGTIFSLTGALGAFGASQQNAVDMAVTEINAAGGVLGQSIVVFHMDDQTSPIVAAQDAMQLVTDGVSVIIGATGSGQCAQVIQIAAANSIVEISPSCTSPVFSNESLTGGWFARTVPSDALQAVVAAYQALYNQSYTYSGVLAIDNAYGTLTAAAYTGNFTRMGGTITSGSPRIVPEGATDYTSDLEAILDVSPTPQTVYVIAYPPDGVTMMYDWWIGISTHPAWANVHWMFSEGVYDPSFLTPLVNAGVNVAGFDGTAPALYAGIVPAGYAAWAARYASIFGTAPAVFAANAYDATYVAALAAEASGAPTGDGIRSLLRAIAGPPGTLVGQDDWANASAELAAGHDINYEGVSGSVNLNVLGDVPSGYIVWGVNASNEFYVQEYFNESAVVAMLPSGFFPMLLPSPWSLGVADWLRRPPT